MVRRRNLKGIFRQNPQTVLVYVVCISLDMFASGSGVSAMTLVHRTSNAVVANELQSHHHLLMRLSTSFPLVFNKSVVSKLAFSSVWCLLCLSLCSFSASSLCTLVQSLEDLSDWSATRLLQLFSMRLSNCKTITWLLVDFSNSLIIIIVWSFLICCVLFFILSV